MDATDIENAQRPACAYELPCGCILRRESSQVMFGEKALCQTSWVEERFCGAAMALPPHARATHILWAFAYREEPV